MSDMDIAKNGMYVSNNSVYVVFETKDGYYLEKNGIKKYSGTDPVLKTIPPEFSGKGSQLVWNTGNSSSVNYIKMINKQTLLDGMDLLASSYKDEFYDKYVEQSNNCKTNVKKLLENKIQSLSSFDNCEHVGNSNYSNFSKEQYVSMALYLDAAKSLGDNVYDEFVSNPYIRSCLYYMSFDHNGMCTKFEEKVEENKQSRHK